MSTKTVNFIIPTNTLAIEINNLLRSYPPIIGISGYSTTSQNGTIEYVMPYNITDICSRCVKIAAAPNSPDSQMFLTEFKNAIQPFDKEVNAMLIRCVTNFINYLQVLFQRYGWYGSDGEAPHRFVGFCNNTLDIELRSR